jgi:hypothetical protein
MNARRLSVVMMSSTHAVSEILLQRVAAEVLERQHGDRNATRLRKGLTTARGHAVDSACTGRSTGIPYGLPAIIFHACACYY